MDLNFTAEELAFQDEARHLLPLRHSGSHSCARWPEGGGSDPRRHDPQPAQLLEPARLGDWPELAWWSGAAKPGSAGSGLFVSGRDAAGQRALADPVQCVDGRAGDRSSSGSQEIKQRFLPMDRQLLDIFWCQGFSELRLRPDLASLRTRAERDKGKSIRLLTGKRSGPRWHNTPTWIFCLRADRPGGETCRRASRFC